MNYFCYVAKMKERKTHVTVYMINFLSGSGILSLAQICPVFVFILSTVVLFASCEQCVLRWSAGTV